MVVKLTFYDDMVYIDYDLNPYPHSANQLIRYPPNNNNRQELSSLAHQFIQENELELLGKNILINIQHKDGLSEFYGHHGN